MNGELGYFFGNVTCIPDYVDQGVSGNYGNCFDPAVGGTNSLWKSCVHVWLDDSKNKTDWRCMCHFTMHSRGNNCLWDWGAGSWWSNGFWFATCALVFFVDACKGVRLCYQMLQLKGFKLNAAITSCIFVTIALFSEAFRHSLYGPRNFPADHPLGLNGKQFDIGLYALPVTVMAMCQAILGLSITGIGIAEKTGNVTGAKRKLKILRAFIWGFMAFMLTLSMYMAVNNMSSQMSSVGIGIFFILIPSMAVASSKLRKLLANGAPPKPGQFNISDCLKKTVRNLFLVGPLFVGGLLLFMICDGNIRKKGPKMRTDWTLCGLMMFGYGLWIIMHTIKNFFVESNAAAFEKFQKSKQSVTTMYGKSSTSSQSSSTSTVQENDESQVQVPASKVVPENA